MRSRIVIGVCGVILAMVAAAALPAAALATLRRVGPAPALTAQTRLAPAVAAGLQLHVAVTLRPRDPAALAAYARAVSTPGSPVYRHYLTPARFGARFGATAAQIRMVSAALRARGLTPGPASTGRLSIPVRATAGALERAFSISLRELRLPGRHAEITADAAPAFAARVASAVQSVVGLDGADAPQPLLVRRTAGGVRRAAAPAHVLTGGPQPCLAASSAAPGQLAYTADQIASAYGFSDLYAAGDQGAGVTVAVYELEPDDPTDIASYQSCYGTHAAISYVPVDGGVGSGPGAGEAALDIENLIGLAPDATVLVYQGPNSNSGSPGSGPYDIFNAIVNQDRARIVSVSWGECESALGRSDASAENILFEQAAAQGQTIIAAAGDSGAEDCDNGGAHPRTEPAVDDPSSQPFVTGVGGTSLHTLGPRPSETVWNNVAGVPGAQAQPGAGGGGVSSLWAMPAAQLDAAAALGIQSGTPDGATCGDPGGWCRGVPDVAADADPNTGYLVFWNGAGQVSGQPTGWQGIGGTSAAAPVWAALLALTDGSVACAGSPIGYADPALYRAAGSAYAADFNDITQGDNDFTQTNGGQFAAGPGYDRASGLGSPNAAALAGSLCADTIKLADPGSQRSAAHASLTLQLTAGGNGLTFHASGLPPGLSLATGSGVVSGTARRTGTYEVRVVARDDESAESAVSFRWTIGAAARISRVGRTTPSSGAPTVSFTVSAGRQSPRLQTLQIALPRTLRLRSRRGIAVSTTFDHRVRFTASVSRAGIGTIHLGQSQSAVRVVLAPPGLAAVTGRLPNTSRASRRLAVTVLDVDAGASSLSSGLS